MLSAVFLAVVPVVVHDQYFLSVLILCLIYGILASGWDFLEGYLGQVNFGYAGFFGLGAYASALIAMRLGVSPWLAIFFGGFFAAAIGLGVGFPCLRLSPGYVAIVTLAFAEIARLIVTRWVELTNGMNGLWGIPPFPDITIGGFRIDMSGVDRTPHYYLILAITVASLFLMRKLVDSRTGLLFLAIREDKDLAEGLGVDTTRHKLIGFTISSFMAGLVGGFFAHYVNTLSPEMLGVAVTVQICAMAVIGGRATLFGPVLGGFLLIGSGEVLRPIFEYRMIIFGLLIVVFLTLFPEGLAGIAGYFRSVAKRSTEDQVVRADTGVSSPTTTLASYLRNAGLARGLTEPKRFGNTSYKNGSCAHSGERIWNWLSNRCQKRS